MSKPGRLIVGILLAAGAARRFGGNKLLATLDGHESIAERACRTLRSATDHVIAVVRPDAEPLAACLAKAGAEVRCHVTADDGMGASLAFGVGCAPDAKGWLVALADMPFLAPDDVRHVTDALRAGASIAVPECEGVRGHPVGFSRSFGDTLRALRGDTGARDILKAHPHLIVPVLVTDSGSWQDIDTVDDLRRACLAQRR